MLSAKNTAAIKQNKNCHYKNVEIDKLKVLNIVDGLFLETQSLDDIIYGSKNLIYFSSFGNEYCLLLKMLLESIHAYTPIKNFDILIMCDTQSQDILQSYDILNHFNYYFYILSTPEDGVAASIYKTQIFNYENINKYNKILFLDCDIIVIKNINLIFDYNIDTNILYTAHNPMVPMGSHNGVFHGVSKIEQTDLENLILYDQKPFNAGQFLFINSTRMKGHFFNITWFIEHWPGKYFFEQAFMTQYFCRKLLTNYKLLEKLCVIMIIPKNQNYDQLHDDSTILIHFAGPALHGTKKYIYTKNYIEKFKLLCQ